MYGVKVAGCSLGAPHSQAMSRPGAGVAGNVIAKPAFRLSDYQTMVDGTMPRGTSTRPSAPLVISKASSSSGEFQFCEIIFG